MPDLYRVTFIFKGVEHGWGEGLIYSSNGTTVNGVLTSATVVAEKRAKLLGREYSLKAVRCAQIFRDAVAPAVVGTVLKHRGRLKEFNPPLQGAQTEANSGDQVNQCVEVSFWNGEGDRMKTLYMGGIPDRINEGGGILDTAAGGWQGRFDSWKASLLPTQGTSWGWIGDAVNLAAGITNYVTDEQGYTTFTLDGAIFAAPFPPQIVRVKGLNSGQSGLNGALMVKPINGTTCVTLKAIATLAFRGKGVMTSYSKPYIGAAEIAPDGIVEHKRGRPIGASRGRLPARKRT